jgi:hypothetical protein
MNAQSAEAETSISAVVSAKAKSKLMLSKVRAAPKL